MLNRIFVVDAVTLTSTGTAVSTYTPWEQSTRKLPTQVAVKATGQGAYVRLSHDNSAATNADVLVQAGDHVVLSVQGRRWVSVLSDGASSTVNVGALSTGVSGSAVSLDLVFAGAQALDPQITFTRASTGTFFDATGTLQSAAIDAPRLDYNPATLAAQGLLIEEQRTNSIRNNTMVGAVAGTPGTVPTNWDVAVSGTGITQQIIGTGTEDGITYIDIKFSGTGSGSAVPQIRPETTTQIVAATGQTWSASYYLRIVGGSTTGCAGTFQQIWQERDASGIALTTTAVAISDPTTAALKTQRSILTRILTDAGAARLTNRIQWSFTNGVAVDITLRIGLPQLELGAFATSVIPTTTTALTRSADVASVNTLAPWFNSAAGTIYAEAVTFDSLSSAFPRPFSVSDGTNSNVIQITRNNSSGTARMSVVSGGLAQAAADLTTWTLNATTKVALAYATNDFAGVANGGAVTTDTSGTVPTVSRLNLAADGTGLVTQINGWLRRVSYFPRRLSNAELQSLTA